MKELMTPGGSEAMYATIRADIRGRRVIPREPEKLPTTGQALIVVLPPETHREQWQQVRGRMGFLTLGEDPAAWQRNLRREWDRPR
jgi:hypothetical protein